MGIELPKTRDPKALSMLAASGAFSYADKVLRFKQLELRLDDTTLRGALAIVNPEAKAMTFDLAVA